MNNKPDFLVIGVQKAATSWLWVQLKKHPYIWLPPVKELHFFDHLFVERNRSWTEGHIRKGVREALKWQINHARNLNPDYLKYLIRYMDKDMFSEEWYERAFDRNDLSSKLTGDVTPEYCTISEEGVEYVKSYLPYAKIIWIIRDPLSRADSQLRMNISRRGINPEGLSRDEWIELAMEPDIYERASYRDYIPRWDSKYDNILYIPYNSIAERPQIVLNEVFGYLGLDQCVIEQADEKVHVGRPLEIPNYVSQYMSQRFEDHNMYLKERFSPQFLSEI